MDELLGKTVLVTAGCGFIGSHLVRRLLQRGVKRVLVVDNLQYGTAANLGNLGERQSRVEIARFTLGLDPVERLAPLVDGVDYLLHLAAEKSRATSAAAAPEAILERDVRAAWQLFDLASRAGVAKVVFTSSLHVYGRASPPAMAESEVPRPLNVYGIGKLACEHLLDHFHHERGLNHAVLRLFFVYGPRQYVGGAHGSTIVENLQRILGGERPVIRGDGEQVLDYVYVDDVVEAIERAMLSAGGRETFNVCSGSPISIRGLVESMLEVTGSKLEPLHVEPDGTARSYRVGDAEKIRKALGWQPRVSLREGLSRTREWLEGEARR